MSTRLLETSFAKPAYGVTGSARYAPKPLSSRPGFLPLLAVFVLGVLVAAGNTGFMLFGIGLFAAGVLLSNSGPAPIVDPVELSLTAFLTVVIAVPFGKLPHDRATSIIFVVALLTISLSGLARATENPPRGRVVAIAFFALLVPASLLGPDKGAIKFLALTAAAALPAFFLGGQLNRARLRTISLVLLALALAESVLAVIEPFAFPGHLWVSAPVGVDGVAKTLKNPFFSGYERSQATFGHPLALGILLVIAFALLIRVLSDMKLSLRLFSGAVLLVGLVFTGDRSCLLAVLFIIIAGTRLTATRVFISLGLAIVGVLFVISANLVSGNTVSSFSSSGSYLHRVSAYGLIWKLMSTQPLAAAFGGNGFGSTQRLFDKGLLQTDGFNVVDNQFVLTQAQGGILALAALVVLALLAIRFARPQLRPVILFAIAVSVIFDWMSWPSASALIFTLMGAALANVQPSKVTDRYLLESLDSSPAPVPYGRQVSVQG
jgi:hypothetical protein